MNPCGAELVQPAAQRAAAAGLMLDGNNLFDPHFAFGNRSRRVGSERWAERPWPEPVKNLTERLFRFQP